MVHRQDRQHRAPWWAWVIVGVGILMAGALFGASFYLALR